MKRGGEINKKDPNMPIIASQMGGATMVDTPSYLANIKLSLENFGNALSVLNNAVKDSPSNTTGPIATSKVHMAEATANAATAINLQKISEAAYKAFRTGTTGVAGDKGVYDNVLKGVFLPNTTTQVTYQADTTVAPTPAADLAGAYESARSIWGQTHGNDFTGFPTTVQAWATTEGIAT